MNCQPGDGLQKSSEPQGCADSQDTSTRGSDARSFEIGEIVEGEIKEFTKTGFLVDIGLPLLSFVPFNLLAATKPHYLPRFLGERAKFKIINYNSERTNFVLDRFSAINEEDRNIFIMNNKIDITDIEGFKLDMELVGVVKTIKDYGIFVRLGFVEALLHVNEMNGKSVSDFTKGQLIRVIVNKVDPEKKQIGVKLSSP